MKFSLAVAALALVVAMLAFVPSTNSAEIALENNADNAVAENAALVETEQMSTLDNDDKNAEVNNQQEDAALVEEDSEQEAQGPRERWGKRRIERHNKKRRLERHMKIRNEKEGKYQKNRMKKSEKRRKNLTKKFIRSGFNSVVAKRAVLPNLLDRANKKLYTYESGFCVTKDNRDVKDKVMKMPGKSFRNPREYVQQRLCARKCLRVKGATAAEVIFRKRRGKGRQNNKGCYCHKSNRVSKGNGVGNHKCMVFANDFIARAPVRARAPAPARARAPAPAPRSKNAAYGKRSHNSLIGHIRQIERELNNEKKQVNSAAYARCTKNTRSNVRLVRHSFATGPRAFGVVGCRRGSRCDSVSRKNIQNMKSHASCVVNSRNLGKANTRKIKQNNNIIRSNHQAIRRTKNRSAKLTREYNVEKRNHKEAESVLRAVRKRLRRSGKLVFTEQEEKVLGVAFLEVVEDLKRTKQRGSVNRLINLIEKLIRDFNAKEALLDKAQRLQLSNKRNLIRTKNVDTTRRNGQNRRLSVSTRTTAAKQRGCQIRFNMFHKVMRTFPQNCVKAHKVFKATMADILRELRVIADIKRLVNRRGGALKKVKSF